VALVKDRHLFLVDLAWMDTAVLILRGIRLVVGLLMVLAVATLGSVGMEQLIVSFLTGLDAMG